MHVGDCCWRYVCLNDGFTMDCSPWPVVSTTSGFIFATSWTTSTSVTLLVEFQVPAIHGWFGVRLYLEFLWISIVGLLSTQMSILSLQWNCTDGRMRPRTWVSTATCRDWMPSAASCPWLDLAIHARAPEMTAICLDSRPILTEFLPNASVLWTSLNSTTFRIHDGIWCRCKTSLVDPYGSQVYLLPSGLHLTANGRLILRILKGSTAVSVSSRLTT